MNRLDADEIMQGTLREKTNGTGAAGMLAVSFYERAETGFFMPFEFVRQDEFPIEDIFHFTTQDVGEAAGHAGAEIEADGAENGGDSAGHVLATMLAHAFDNGDGTAVADGEPFADLPGDE